MKKYYIEEFDRLEKSHWWHIAKRELIATIINRKIDRTKGKPDLLEIGAGTANISAEFIARTSLTVLDKSQVALSFCRKKGIRNLIRADFEKYQATGKLYDIIIAADVLEHFRDDKKALVIISRMLKKNGLFIVHVPANPSLSSYWDKSLGHYRRYETDNLKSLLMESGFSVTFASKRVSFLYPLIRIFRRINKITSPNPPSDFTRLSSLNSLFLAITRIENFLVLQNIVFPFGTSIIAVSEKNG